MSAYAKNPVGAHYGLGAWLMQRLTAVVMAAYTLFLLVLLLRNPPATWGQWQGLFADPFVRVATMLFFVALLYHAWVGVRDIIMDYVKPTGLRLGLQALAGTALAFYLVWSASILWGR